MSVLNSSRTFRNTKSFDLYNIQKKVIKILSTFKFWNRLETTTRLKKYNILELRNSAHERLKQLRVYPNWIYQLLSKFTNYKNKCKLLLLLCRVSIYTRKRMLIYGFLHHVIFSILVQKSSAMFLFQFACCCSRELFFLRYIFFRFIFDIFLNIFLEIILIIIFSNLAIDKGPYFMDEQWVRETCSTMWKRWRKGTDWISDYWISRANRRQSLT